MTASPSPATRDGFTSEDGWEVRFERVITALGDIRLEDAEREGAKACNAYGETRYDWLFDLKVVGEEKVGLVFGLGDCQVRWRVRTPSSDGVLGLGATTSDRERLRELGSDAYSEDERTAVQVIGAATRGGVEKRFEWLLRRGFELQRCPEDATLSATNELTFSADSEQTMRVEVRAEELFRAGPSDNESLLFEPFAAADADGDGDLTLEELGAAAPPPTEVTFPAEDDLHPGPPASLADLVYEHALPRLTRVRGGPACSTEERGRR